MSPAKFLLSTPGQVPALFSARVLSDVTGHRELSSLSRRHTSPPAQIHPSSNACTASPRLLPRAKRRRRTRLSWTRSRHRRTCLSLEPLTTGFACCVLVVDFFLLLFWAGTRPSASTRQWRWRGPWCGCATSSTTQGSWSVSTVRSTCSRRSAIVPGLLTSLRHFLIFFVFFNL
jgi:hypothetical protein